MRGAYPAKHSRIGRPRYDLANFATTRILYLPAMSALDTVTIVDLLGLVQGLILVAMLAY